MLFTSLPSYACLLIAAAALTGCGSSGGGDSAATPVTPVTPTPTTTKNFKIEPSSAAGVTPSLDAHRNGDGTVYFSGKLGMQRIASSQTIDNAPPAKLSVRFVDVSTGISFGTNTVSRGALAVGDSLDGSADHNGVWYYSFLDNLGYSLPGGTSIRAEVMDNGDTFAASGDELQANGYKIYINVPLAAADNSLPIPVHTFTVPGPG